LPDISANIDCLETLLASIKMSFQGLFEAVETMEIIEELVEIGSNKVCNRFSD